MDEVPEQLSDLATSLSSIDTQVTLIGSAFDNNSDGYLDVRLAYLDTDGNTGHIENLLRPLIQAQERQATLLEDIGVSLRILAEEAVKKREKKKRKIK